MVFIVISILVIIVTINLNISTIITYNVYKNLGQLKIKLLGLTIFNSEISLIAGYFNLRRKNKKVIQIKLDINDEKFKLLGDIGQYFTKKIYLSRLSTSFDFYGTNPAIISLVAGNVMVIEGVVRSIISSKSPDTTLSNKINVDFADNNIKIKFSIGILITLFDFIWAIIRAFIKRSVYDKTKVRGNS